MRFYRFFIIFKERITFDTGIKCVIVEKRTIANKKLELEWKEAKTIKFSDLQRINVIEQYNQIDTGPKYCYQIDLIIVDGGEKMLSILWDDNSESAKNLALKICKIIGIKAYYIDEKKKSNMLKSSLT